MLFNGLIFAGIIQGFLLSFFILFSKNHQNKSSKYLGYLILAFTLANLQYSLEELDLISTQVLNYIYFPYLFLIAPFLFFFGMYYIYPERTIKFKEKLLYLPFAIFFLVIIVYKIIAIFFLKTEALKQFLKNVAYYIDTYSDLINTSLMFYVVIFLLIQIKKYKTKHALFESKLIKQDFLWLKVFLYLLLFFTFIWTYYTIAYIINKIISFYPIFILTSVLIYMLGHIGIYKIKIFEERQKIRNHTKNQKSVFSNKKNPHIIELEKLIIQQKLFLDPTLSLDMLAEKLNLSKNYLSKLLNKELGVSFNDYLNNLRVEKVKELLKNPEFNNYTLVSIGLEAGFNSKSTFNKAFKKVTKMTPSAYKKLLN